MVHLPLGMLARNMCLLTLDYGPNKTHSEQIGVVDDWCTVGAQPSA
jgi:hypothetical protein